MPRTNPTSVALTGTIQKIKNELAGIYGLKNLLSAGTLLFYRLSDSEQKNVIKDVNKIEKADKALPMETEDAEELLEKLREIFSKEEGNKTMFAASDIVKIITDFRRQISPKEIADQLKKKKA